MMGHDIFFHVACVGKGNRATAPTLMNAESSRSHSILLIKINQKTRDGDDSELSCKLYCLMSVV